MKKVYLVLYSEDDQIIDIIAEDNPKKDWRVLRNDYAYLRRAEEEFTKGEVMYFNIKGGVPKVNVYLKQ